MMVYLRKYKHVVVLMLLLAVGVSCEKYTSGNGNPLIKNNTLEVNSDDFNTYHAPKDIDEVRKLYTVWEQKERDGIFKKETLITTAGMYRTAKLPISLMKVTYA